MATVRRAWPDIITRAASLATLHAAAYGPPTLRRVHYLLVSDLDARAAGYENTEVCYKQLSNYTTKARDAGTFPALADMGRTIEHAAGWSSPAAPLRWLAEDFILDRSARLPVQVIILAEKAGIVPVLTSRYDWLTVSALRGYSSVSHAQALASLDDRRPAVALYVGDYDPSGLDIDRAIAGRLPFPVRRVALSAAQVTAYGLPPVPSKKDPVTGRFADSRATGMIAAHGVAEQVEMDALDPRILLDLVADAIIDETGCELNERGRLVDPDADEIERAARARYAELAEEF